VLEDQEIGRELFGYKKDDVDKLLAELHRELRTTKEERDQLIERLKAAEDSLAKYEDISDTLKNTMISAEKTSSEIVEESKKEAELIITKAKSEAANIIEAADTEREALESGFEALKNAEQNLHAKIKSILSSYMNIVEEIKPEAAVAAKKATITPAVAPEEKVIAVKREEAPSESRDKQIVEILSKLADIQGVSTSWIFDDKAGILSSFNRLKIDLQGVTSALVSLGDCTDQLESELQGENVRLMFIEFDKVVLIINPLTDNKTLGVIASVNAPVGQILWYLDKEAPKLRSILS